MLLSNKQQANVLLLSNATVVHFFKSICFPYLLRAGVAKIFKKLSLGLVTSRLH